VSGSQPPTLFNRALSITVGKKSAPPSMSIDVGSDPNSTTQGGQTLSLQDLHCQFEVTQVMWQMPWHLVLTVWNPRPDYFAAMLEYTDITVVAGYNIQNMKPVPVPPIGSAGYSQPTPAQPQQLYKPGGGIIFQGDIVWYERGRENATDTYLRIWAVMNDRVTNNSMINQTIDTPHNDVDVINACIKAFQAQNQSPHFTITAGPLPDAIINSPISTRSRTLCGLPIDIIRDVAQTYHGYAYFDLFGQLHIVTDAGLLPNGKPVIPINSTTGMIGVPRMNLDASISVIALLNSNIVPGGIIQLNEQDIVRQSLTPQGNIGSGVILNEQDQATQNALTRNVNMAAIPKDGFYSVWSVVHTGDTRGDAWYSEITTRGLDMSTQPVKGISG
jgi:hypothetical protein